VFQKRQTQLCKSYISAFDLDRTLIQKNSAFCFGSYLIRKCTLPYTSFFSTFFYHMKYRFFDLSLSDLHYHLFDKILRGRLLDTLSVHMQPFLEESISQIFYGPAMACLERAKKEKHYTVLLSSSPNFIVEPIAALLGVDEWKSSIYGVDEEGRLEKIDSLMQGEEKAEHLMHLSRHLSVKKEKIFAYSDSYHDLPFLLSAGTPIAVNPDRKLRLFSFQNHWHII